MWYHLQNPDRVISPSLLFYEDRIRNNIRNMVNIAGDADRLVPHIKTHKSPEIVRIQLEQGINKFKCATIAEAEMLAGCGAKWILIAYQMVGPNVDRLFKLKEAYPYVTFSSLIDNEASADELNAQALERGVRVSVFLDINNGMNRSGHGTDESLLSLYRHLATLTHVDLAGAHVYDGHIRNPEFSERKQTADQAFEKVLPLIDLITQDIGKTPMIIAGGSPSFTVHALRDNVFLSPGTNVLWDWGYGDRFDGQPFEHAALVLTRVVSKPAPGVITIDLGHKSIAAENTIENRFKLLDLANYTVTGQSEEHGVLNVTPSAWDSIKIGDVFYALPYHICPTVALHNFATVVEEGVVKGEWEITARARRITI